MVRTGSGVYLRSPTGVLANLVVRAGLPGVTLLLVWWLARWRVVIAREGLQRAYRARIGERERIARDLHDTLLQSMQALVLLVDAARGRLERGDGEAAKAGLSRAICEANAGLVESRDRIRDLRQ
jgi:signal transduction histidine kinase